MSNTEKLYSFSDPLSLVVAFQIAGTHAPLEVHVRRPASGEPETQVNTFMYVGLNGTYTEADETALAKIHERIMQIEGAQELQANAINPQGFFLPHAHQLPGRRLNITG